jgi:hypothetical protein
MDNVAILRRVEHTIQQCRDFNMEFDARTVAEIMADEDTAAGKYEALPAERAFAFVEYEKAPYLLSPSTSGEWGTGWWRPPTSSSVRAQIA